MTTIDLTPLYRNSIGFEPVSSLFDNAFRSEQGNAGYPAYDIEVLDENGYAITLAVAGFVQDELDIQVEPGLLIVKGKKDSDKDKRKYLYQAIANRSFERKFSLADHVEVVGAKLDKGLLTIELKQELPEAMKPRRITINSGSTKVLEHNAKKAEAA